MKIEKIKKLFNILKRPFFLRALSKGTAAGTEHISVLKHLSCNYVVDIGANRGQFALVARYLFPGSCIHSFEPLTEPANVFEKVFSVDDNVHLHRCAVGPVKISMTIHVSERDDSSSLLPIGENQSKLFPHTGESETRTTDVFPLSDMIDANEITNDALLKIDVQGFELEVLKGCSTLIDSFKYVYVECSFVELYEGQAFASEVIAFLHKKNFVLSGVSNMCYDHLGKAIQADFLFKNISLYK